MQKSGLGLLHGTNKDKSDLATVWRGELLLRENNTQ